ncbi:FAD/NAD(P)-binding domain-containing protein [Hortaea werneckii]|uniref:Amine oxidase n=1 Tax=Hortaea werneckii TaxID=91943 RepID=A0A3M7FX49_HORWE|nr:FAD/NAD(P)-binding domain-containing protein [Hortaea werneckii]RMY93449.1 hypothetical protein D0862_09208 [Hortaea werneckii]
MPLPPQRESRTTDGYQYSDSGPSCRGLWTDAVAPSSSATRSNYDVIVIGAGFAGLVAARDLSLDRNLRVLLIEARDRIGGRTWTAKAFGEEFEMGGTYVHWTQPHFYAELHRHGLERHLKTSAGSTAMDHVLYKPKGEDVRRLEDIKQYNDTLARVAEDLFSIDGMTARELMPYPHDPLRPQPWMKYDYMSVQDRFDQLKLPDADKNLFAAHTNSFGSGAAWEIAYTDALRWYALGGYSLATMYDAAASFKLGKGGMTNLARHTLSQYNGDRTFGKAIESLRQTEGSRVAVGCADGTTYNARWVICTIPLNVLPDIRFDPPLSLRKQDAIKDGHINSGEKYHFFVDEVQNNWFANTSDADNSDFLFGLKDHNGTQGNQGTFSMCFGYNRKLADPSDSRHVISEFKKLQPAGNVKGYLSHTWSKDPYAKGAWYCAGPGSTTKNLQALQEAHGRIVLASADWAQGWRGFIDGAIEQGSRAAQTVKMALEQGDLGPVAKL